MEDDGAVCVNGSENGQGRYESGSEYCEEKGDVHAVLLCYGADVVGGGDGACDGSLLLIIWEAFSGKEGGAALGDLDDNGGLDVTSAGEGRLDGDRAEMTGTGDTGRPQGRSLRRRRTCSSGRE